MKLIIDLQACQSPESRNRGIGRYSQSLALSIARQAQDHDLWLFLTDVYPESIESIRKNYDGLIAQDKIIVWQAPELTSEFDKNSIETRIKVEAAREAFLTSLNPDFIHVSSLFETHQNCVTSIGHIHPHSATSVTLYDLIPLVHKDRYLIDDNARWWYMRKLSQLKNADLLLAISEHSRSEAIDYLSIPSNKVVNILGAADSHFKRINLSPIQVSEVHTLYGLVRPFIMYTGGIDFRKNIEGLISSFARLPIEIRRAHQLAIVCKVLDVERDLLMGLAAKEGLGLDEVILTGYIPERHLVVLYNTCKLFIFPSWHEGFGLPVLEAMSCGAPVITANTTSLPEIVGRSDAMFNPHDLHSITSKMAQSLSDPDFRTSLISSGLIQAAKFNWDNTGKIALTAFNEAIALKNKSKQITVSTAKSKPKLAYVSPMPPEKTGIANYSAELLPFLAEHFDIVVIVGKSCKSESIIPDGCDVQDDYWFNANGNKFKHIIYHFGNSLFHKYMDELIIKFPGIVVLHDFYLSGPPAHLDLTGEEPGIWSKSLFKSHGYHSLYDLAFTSDYTSMIYKYPCNKEILKNATEVIVHSTHAQQLAHRFYGKDSTYNWHVIPLIRVPKYISKHEAKTALEIDPDDFVCCSFGILSPSKLIDLLIEAWLSSCLAGKSNIQLIFVGENIDENYTSGLQSLLKTKPDLSNNIRITGFVDNNNYQLYLSAADMAIQLRTSSRGETSAAALDCIAASIPLIVNSHGSMAELPSNVVVKLQDKFTCNELVSAIEYLYKDGYKRKALMFDMTSWVKINNSPFNIANKYKDTILNSINQSQSIIKNIEMNKIEELHIDDSWKILSINSLNQLIPALKIKQLFVDISVLHKVNANTGIQKVVIGILRGMLLNPLPGIVIEPVYLNDSGEFFYARNFCSSFMGYGYLNFIMGLKDEPININTGDIFLGLDLAVNQINKSKNAYQKFKNLGVKITFVVYDLLPFLHPEWFEKEDIENYSNWLKSVCEYSEEVFCISESVGLDFLNFYSSLNIDRKIRVNTLKIGTMHFGKRIQLTSLNKLNKIYHLAALEKVDTRPIFLMVGTLEPRKGHSEVIDAFEVLWSYGHQFKLVIAGRLGWLSKSLEIRIRNNPEFNNLLQWHDDVSDEQILELYKSSTALIVASHAEGLGLTLIEAGVFGLPIIARDIPVFREIAKDHALYFNGKDDRSLVNVILNWIKLSMYKTVPDSSLIDVIDIKDSANYLMNMLLLPSGDISSEVIKPHQYERMISFGNSLTKAHEESSRQLDGIIDGGYTADELVISFLKIKDDVTTTLQENAISLSKKSESLRIIFEFKAGEFFAKINIGDLEENFRANEVGNKYAIKFMLRELNHKILYEYFILFESTDQHPKGKLYFSNKTELNKLYASLPTIRVYAPTIMPRDAVGNYCKNTSKLLKSNGYNVQIYADNYDILDFGEIKKSSELYRDIEEKDIIIVNYSIYDPQFVKIRELSNFKILIFQNVTPSYFFEKWDSWSSVVCSASTEQFEGMSNFDKIFVSSTYSGSILESYFLKQKIVNKIPPFYKWQYLENNLEQKEIPKKTNLLFVGRIVANKCIDDLIQMLFEYLKFDWEATLTIVGSDWNLNYRNYLDDLINRLGFATGKINLTGSLNDSELVQKYNSATAFVCMSEHEGYCIPIVEAMIAKIPIFAYNQPAIKELLNGAGVLFLNKDFWNWAEVISTTLKNEAKMKVIIEKQNFRLSEVLAEAEGTNIIECIKSLY